MTPLEMIQEWRKGCSCGGPIYDRIMDNPQGTTGPEHCTECTRALIDALEAALQRYEAARVMLGPINGDCLRYGCNAAHKPKP